MNQQHRKRLGGAALIALSLLASPVRAEDVSATAEKTVDAMNVLWGKHPGVRANHAKGVVVEGSFRPDPAAQALTTASILRGGPVPVTVRFSDSTGMPALADGSDDANPHGMAIKFHLADGGEMDIVSNSLKFFPVATGAEFLELLEAIAQSGPGASKPSPVERFLGAHPRALQAFGALRTPSSFAREVYNGVDAFVFVSTDGKRQPFRYRVDPAAGVDYLEPAAAAARAPDFLVAELPERLKAGPVTFDLNAQLAEPGDAVADPSQAWPAERKVTHIGTIVLDKAVADSAGAEKALLFMPQNLTAGIEASDDPLIDVRNASYAISFGRRSQ